MDGHRKAISHTSSAHAVTQVVGILRPEMGSPKHRVVVMQQLQESLSKLHWLLVQINLLDKTLAQAQKELSRVLIANKGLKEKAGRLEKANRVLETEGASASQQLLRLEKELAQLKQEAPMQPAPMQPPMKPAPMQPPMQRPTQQPAPMQQQRMQQQEGKGGFDAEEQDPSTAAAKQVRLIVAGGVVVIVLVQINLLGKALLKAQKELAMQQQPMQQPMQYQPMQYQQQPMQ